MGDADVPFFPLVADPAKGQEVGRMSTGIISADILCWKDGVLTDHLVGLVHAPTDWVKVVGGSYKGLWIPLGAVGMDNPDIARSLPNCTDWRLKVWPFG